MRGLVAIAGVAVLAAFASPSPVTGQASQGQFVPRDETPEEFPAGAGRDETFYACTACHNFKLIAQQGMNRGQWEESIDLMASKHKMPPLDVKDRETVLNYLEATYPPRAAPRGGWVSPFKNR